MYVLYIIYKYINLKIYNFIIIYTYIHIIYMCTYYMYIQNTYIYIYRNTYIYIYIFLHIYIWRNLFQGLAHVIMGTRKPQIHRAGQQTGNSVVDWFCILEAEFLLLWETVFAPKSFNSLNEVHPHYWGNLLSLKPTGFEC